MHEQPPQPGLDALLSRDLPPITGELEEVKSHAHPARDLQRVQSACAVALHMHQPLVPAGGERLESARLIGNLEHMLSVPGSGDHYNATVYLECYRRMGEYIPALIEQGFAPRVMLDYSGTLLHGLEQLGRSEVLDSLRRVTLPGPHQHAVEWLGSSWGHAVAPSTPVLDYRRHVGAWRQHFAALFGAEALSRVRGFSLAEMALPNHPDVAYELVCTLRAAGYEWLLVQEHTVEDPSSGESPRERHLPHRLVCTSSRGESASIIAIVKTQGSDSKLVGQMQPWYEAKTLPRALLGGRQVPQLVTQIADGENGGVMMNEFPSKYLEVARLASGSETPLLNVSEYLDGLFALGVNLEQLPALQPVFQRRLWQRFEAGSGSDRLTRAIGELKAEDGRFHMEGGSWTNDISWVRGYEPLLNEMEKVSALFHEKVDASGVPRVDPRYRAALYHLLCSQTSCFRYWGEGPWTNYGRELCRRARAIITREF